MYFLMISLWLSSLVTKFCSQKRNVTSTNRENTKRAPHSYPINNCSFPGYEMFSEFSDSYCIEEIHDRSSWKMYCSWSEIDDEQEFVGYCDEGYTCVQEATDDGPGPFPVAWCVTRGTSTNSTNGSDNGAPPGGFSFNSCSTSVCSLSSSSYRGCSSGGSSSGGSSSGGCSSGSSASSNP